MTVCLKCGAENPPTNQYCTRCEMPLPHSGVGQTLQGGGTHERPGTLPLSTGIPMQTMFGGGPAPAAAAPGAEVNTPPAGGVGARVPAATAATAA
ncbi:MAG: hypothetical protein RL033_5348, partial [Pseudomonadota bacterium]